MMFKILIKDYNIIHIMALFFVYQSHIFDKDMCLFSNIRLIFVSVCFSAPGQSLDQAAQPIIRLAGGNKSHEGRVEVYHRGTWGTICGHFGWNEAVTVCRQLGFKLVIHYIALYCLSWLFMH